jgi:hypothetical protein
MFCNSLSGKFKSTFNWPIYFKVLFIIILIGGCSRKDESLRKYTSPSGNYLVSASVNKDKSDKTKYLCLKLYLWNNSQDKLFSLQTEASSTMKWALGWMETADIVVLYSSDIGTRAYSINNNRLDPIELSQDIIKRGDDLKYKKYKK